MDKQINFRDINGLYSDEGSGNPIVLVHGFCEDGGIWDGFRNSLAGNFRVIIPDLPGYRNSGMTKQELTIDWMADFVKAILDNEKIERPIIIGHSMGGYVTLALTDKHPSFPERIGLFHSHCFADKDEKKKNRKRSIDFINKNGTGGFVNELYNNLFGEKFHSENEMVVDQFKTIAKEYPAQTVTRGLQAMIDRPNRAHVLKSFKRPVLFILGKQDKTIPYSQSLEQCAFPVISQVHLLEHSGHMGMIEEPKKTLEMLLEFTNLTVGQLG